MKIAGLQKMTLLDYPGKVACTVFLAGCDLRCPFCHNAGLLDASAPAAMEVGDLLRFLEQRRGLLDGVAITGGEPLLRDLKPLLTEIRSLGYPVKLDTNGTHPEALGELLELGLADYVAMDVKNSPERYARTVGLEHFDLGPVRESIALLLGGKTDCEFRTTAVAELHDDASFHGIGAMIRGAKRHFLQPFQDRDTVPFAGLHAPAPADLGRWREIMAGYVTRAEIRG
ncbi:MAG: anaerobic ribonucleoside-triphosphate reductase activating protein [Oscillospiraceae bacterium]|nr:anaerobic ribonucleoside-triphosphate reductase activating protein [Oscillospiraceae bacterium]